jgi:hypothetical protein
MAKATNRWDSIFADWETSGLTKKEYCQKHGYSANAFYTAMGRKRKKSKVPVQSLIRVYPETIEEPKSFED